MLLLLLLRLLFDDPLPPPLFDNKDVEGNILLIDSYDRSMPVVDFFDIGIVVVDVSVEVGFLRVNEEYAFFFD